MLATQPESDSGNLSLDAEKRIPEEPVGKPARPDLCSEVSVTLAVWRSQPRSDLTENQPYELQICYERQSE